MDREQRATRLADELRRNLRRRKAQAREVVAPPDPEPGPRPADQSGAA